MVVDAVRLLLAAETTCDMQSKREGEGNVGDHRIPRPIGEDRGGVIGGLHHSPVKIWAERLEAA
jgi:hypothetical protein